MILLIGSDDDPHLIGIKNYIQKTSQINCELLSTSRKSLLNSKFYFTSNNEDHRLTITQKNTRFDTRETRAAFCTSPIHRANQKQNQEERFWYHSWKEVLHGFYAELAEKNTLINTSIETSTAGQNKIKLHGAARKSKLKIPDTIITNQE